MRWPAARITAPDQRAKTRLLLFGAAELLLAMAIPFLLIHGYHALLSSNAGTFVDGPTVDEPGWSALVSATPVTAVVEVVDGAVSGAALIVPPGDAALAGDGASPATTVGTGVAGGTVVLISGDLAIPPGPATGLDQLDPAPRLLSELAPESVGDVLAELLNIDIASVVVMDDAAWTEALIGASYDLDNPDPVPADPDTAAGTRPADLAFAVGPTTVEGSTAAVFLGRPVDGAPLASVMPRRHRLWAALIAEPPNSVHPLSAAVGTVGIDGRIVDLPTTENAGGISMDRSATEELVREIVAFPSGRRLEVRLVDRTGDADLFAVAADLAARGIEVVEIANAVQFDDGSTEIIRPADPAVGAEQLDELAAELGVEPIVDPEQSHDTVTLLLGDEYHLSS